MHETGYIEIKDRLKDIIISGGENISSVEIEGILHKHPAVSIAAVIAKPDEKWGEVPCAFVELKKEKSITEEELMDFCRKNLAGFKRPKQIVFCEIPSSSAYFLYEINQVSKSALDVSAKTVVKDKNFKINNSVSILYKNFMSSITI